jgi:hypothetical protein
LGYDCSANPGFGDGQGYYDLSMAVSPVNANNVFVGGISIYESQDGGVTWSLPGNSCWYYGIHPDQHYTLFSPHNPNDIYEGNDGGITESRDLGNTWNIISSNMRTTQYRGSEASLSEANVVIGGSQDNGTIMIRDDSALEVAGGDGTGLTYFDGKDDDIISLVETTHFAIIDSGNTIVPSMGDFQFNPQNSNAIECYQGALYKSYDFGSTWSLTHSADSTLQSGFYINFPTGDSSEFLTVMIPSYQLYKVNTKTGAATELTTNIKNIFIFNFCGSNTDTNKVWVSGTINDTSRIFYTSNGGTTWTDVTHSLYGYGVGSMVYQNNSNDAVYIAANGGVYYTDDSQTDWIDWSNGLPDIGVNELSINYPTSELVASTYGRGIWKGNLYTVTGITEVTANNASAKIYPNPNRGNFIVRLLNVNQTAQVEIFNVLGKNVYTAKLNSNSNTINIHNQAAGIYLYRVTTTDGQLIANGKLVIE